VEKCWGAGEEYIRLAATTMCRVRVFATLLLLEEVTSIRWILIFTRSDGFGFFIYLNGRCLEFKFRVYA
jgi:hypothetical protein